MGAQFITKAIARIWNLTNPGIKQQSSPFGDANVMSTLASLKNLVGTGELFERETRHASGVAQWG
jgi:hypothetical protein